MYPLVGTQPYPFNAWYMAAWKSELTDNLLPRTVLGTPVVLFRDEEGRARALDDRCPHRRYPLSKGSLSGGVVTCNYHGYAFNGQGKCLSVPSMTRPTSGQKAKAFPVRESWNWIWLWMGDPALAEEVPLPDETLVHSGDPDWTFLQGGLVTVKGRYMLLHENLLDLSHLSFLHRTTVGSPGIASAKLHVRDTDGGLLLEREVLADKMEGTPLGQAMGIAGPVDRIMLQTYSAPALHVTSPRFLSAASGGTNPGHLFGAFSVIHVLTPETPTTTHYFWGFTRNFRHDAAFGETLASTIRRAVVEDVDAAEAIERLLDADADPDEDIHSPADTASIKGRRIMQRLIDVERAPATASVAGGT